MSVAVKENINAFNYRYILIDCMPSLGMMTINTLAASDRVLIPAQPSYLSTKGLDLLLQSIVKVKKQLNPTLRIDGILLTMVDNRTRNARNTAEALRTGIGRQLRVFDTEIPFPADLHQQAKLVCPALQGPHRD